MGPHGILIGATGSGKSELIRTLVLALAMTHSSETLNMVLVDFKGGATFLGLDGLPHVSALITNLADELALVDRMQDALQGELVRRQELLRRSSFTSIHEYERARAGGAPLEPLPTLVVIVDEFGELLGRQDRVRRTVHDDRPARPVAGRAPAAGLAAVRRGPHPHPGDPPVVPDGPADVLRDGVAQRHRHRRRLRPAARARVPATCVPTPRPW